MRGSLERRNEKARGVISPRVSIFPLEIDSLPAGAATLLLQLLLSNFHSYVLCSTRRAASRLDYVAVTSLKSNRDDSKRNRRGITRRCSERGD